MWRATVLFLAVVALVLGVGTVARNLLGLGCVGPQLPVWGCLAVPYPAVLPSGFSLFYYVGLAAGAWLACYAARNPLFFLGNWLLRRLFPGWMGEFDEAQDPVRSYNLR